MNDPDLQRYDLLAYRVYTEPRMPTGTRDLILALGWVTLRDPHRHDPARSMWERTGEVLNASNRRLWELLLEDVPRYEHDWHADPKGCQAPMARIDRLCGRNTTLSFAESDVATGRFQVVGFCSRPLCRAYGEAVNERAQWSRKQAPAAIPNKGGLLPLFFTWDWERRYRKAMEVLKHETEWEPPVYGLSADEWPTVAGDEPVKAFPKLRLIASDGDIIKPVGPALVSAGGTA
ncbi:hypothetical protein ACIPW9_36395 [Streptomyces sp. NPDC090052]|uniref:hypothetical protein n=1 Tax=Streptomyces sp. NPDC090052 TaxID=3365931 RepID=UPI003821A960